MDHALNRMASENTDPSDKLKLGNKYQTNKNPEWRS